MRDLLLFTVCCCLAAGFWVSSGRRAERLEHNRQTELAQLGAPQTMEASPERSLLLGEFAEGLRANPSPDTYQKLAAAFLASHEIGSRQVRASAVTLHGMARVLGTVPQFFDPLGRTVEPRMATLGDRAVPLDKPLFKADQNATLASDGPWILYRDKLRWAAFRWSGESLKGYLSNKPLTAEGDTLLVAGKRAWEWKSETLEAVSKTP